MVLRSLSYVHIWTVNSEQVRNINACEISKVYHTMNNKHRDRIVLDWMLHNTQWGNEKWTIHCGDYNETTNRQRTKTHNKLPAYGMRSSTMKLEWSVFGYTVVFSLVFFLPTTRADYPSVPQTAQNPPDVYLSVVDDNEGGKKEHVINNNRTKCSGRFTRSQTI